MVITRYKRTKIISKTVKGVMRVINSIMEEDDKKCLGATEKKYHWKKSN